MDRITPAYAGKRSCARCGILIFRDHPRLCGEKIVLHWEKSITIGSPPPMRGKARKFHFTTSSSGITPAYAGKRSKFPSDYNDARDHPRLCGEKHNARTNRTGHVGSPPPMRGKDRTPKRIDLRHRITPAYAGKSSHTRRCPSIDWDHPRLCGEKHLAYTPMQRHRGSPPPMRGKVLLWREG